MAETVLGKLGEAPVVMLCGPIAHWWDENWETPEHWHYVDWRDRVSDVLVDAGFLVYHPHNAFKGTWNNRMQGLNNHVLAMCDYIVNLNPGVPSDGTDEELLECDKLDKPVIEAPPPDFGYWRANTKLYPDAAPLRAALDKLVNELLQLQEAQ